MAHQRTIGRLEIDWSLFLLVAAASQGFSPFLPGEAGPTSLLLSAGILAIAAIRDPGRSLSAITSSPLIFFFASWSLVAALLSPLPINSLLAAGVLILMIIFGSLRQAATQRTLVTFALATSFSLVPSIIGLVVPLGVPVLKHAGSSGGYAGYFPWNSMSGLCAAAALLSVTLVFLTRGFVWWQLPAAAGALQMLIMAGSATATLSCVAAAGVLLGIAALRRTDPRARLLMLVGLAFAVTVLALITLGDVAVLSKVTESTGRTDTASGRTLIWQYALDGISESPFWGYGSSFWDTYGKNSAHNGFLDVTLSSGIPAALALGAIAVIAAVRLARSSNLLLPLFTFGVVTNLTLSQMAVPSVASLALWLAIGAAGRRAAGADSSDRTQPSEIVRAPKPGKHPRTPVLKTRS